LAKASPNLDVPRADGSGIRLNGLYVYPIKSCGGVAVGEWYVDERGLRHDRRWMLVDEAGRFMSQRRFPRMALIGARSVPDGFVVSAPGMPSLEVPLRPPNGKPLRAQIWNDTVDTLTAGGEADRWFGEFLGVRSKLVHMPDESVRPVDPDYGEPGDLVGLTDSFPFLLISEGSLAALNARLEHPLPMNRFRPNLVVGGCDPFAEDDWKMVRIGPITFRVVKPCARCAITTVDQRTAATGREPLRTLATFRREGKKVLFGQNLVHNATGTLRADDPLKVLQDQ
jgi:uncharacterized protein YcbX